jgi:hypothetical protein
VAEGTPYDVHAEYLHYMEEERQRMVKKEEKRKKKEESLVQTEEKEGLQTVGNEVPEVEAETKKEEEKEQEKEGGAAYTIESIENGVRTPDISSMLKCEHGRENYRGMSDILVCELIDNEIIPRYGVESVYQLSYKVKIEIANELWSRYHISRDRIERCLGL